MELMERWKKIEAPYNQKKKNRHSLPILDLKLTSHFLVWSVQTVIIRFLEPGFLRDPVIKICQEVLLTTV